MERRAMWSLASHVALRELPAAGEVRSTVASRRFQLYSLYGSDLGTHDKDSPIWISLAHDGCKGHPLTTRSISNLCEKHIGTSKAHTLRHTFARSMDDAGAKVSEIQARLGHASLATTGRYLAALHSAENTHGEDLARMFEMD